MTFVIDNTLVEGLVQNKSWSPIINLQSVSASTLQLTSTSNFQHTFTGSIPGQIVKMPDATTLQVGHRFELWNMASVSIAVQDFNSNLISSISANYLLSLSLQDNSTSSGVWSYILITPNSAISASASPGFSFGRSGTAGGGTYLQNETVPSNVSGRWVYVTSGSVRNVYVSNELTTTYTIEILYHYGNQAGITSLGTVTVVSANGGAFSVNWPVPSNSQIAVRVSPASANSCKNIVCGLGLTGAA